MANILKDTLCVISVCKYYDSVFKHSIYHHIRGGGWPLTFLNTPYSHNRVYEEDKFTLPVSWPEPQFADFQQKGYFFALDILGGICCRAGWVSERGYEC